MAVYPTPSSANTAYLSITTGLPSFTNFTAMGWFRQDPTGALRNFFYLGNDDYEFGAPYIRVSNFNDLCVEIYDGTSIYDTTGIDPMTSLPTWYHVVYRKTGNLHELFLSDETFAIDCVLQGSILLDAHVTPTHVVTGVGRRCAAQNIKMWEAALTIPEMQAERISAAATRTANLYLSTPLPTASNLLDTSGNGHNWSLGGTAVVTAGPPDLFGTPGPPPDPPSDLVATAVGFGHVTLTWTDNGIDETTQTLQRCQGTACTSWATIATLAPNVTTYDDPFTGDLDPLTKYRYRIRANNVYGSSDWSNIAEVVVNANYAVRFPGTPGNYYHVSPDQTHSFVAPPLGANGWVGYVRINSAGYATFQTGLSNFTRCFGNSLPGVADQNEWDYGAITSTYMWFGVIGGVLTFEAHDGRIAARSITQNTVFFSTAAARDAAVAAFRATYAGLPYGEGATVPINTYTMSSFGITSYWADLPGGINAPPIGNIEQSIVVTGPSLTPNVWYRVGWRWETLPPSPRLTITSSIITLFVDCAPVATGNWDYALMSTRQFSGAYPCEIPGKCHCDVFFGGDPNETHRLGRTVTQFDLTDMKYWTGDAPTELVMAGECECLGVRPPLWWKLRSTADLADWGTGTGPVTPSLYPALPVGTIINVADLDIPWNPCNGDEEPPEPPPPPTPFGTIIVTKLVSPTTDPTSFVITAEIEGTVVFALGHAQSRTFSDVPTGSGYSAQETVPSGYTVMYTVSNGSPVTNITVGDEETVIVTIQNTYTGVPTPPEVPAQGCPAPNPEPPPEGQGCIAPQFGV